MTETEQHLLKTQVKFMWQLILFDTYYTLIDGEHIFLLKILISNNSIKQNDENLSELELKSFW